MKLSKRITLGCALALLLVTLPAATLMARPGHRGGGPFGEFHGGPFAEFMLERIADRLELSDQQLEQIRAVREVYREDLELVSDTARVAHRNLSAQVRADSFDETAIREAAGQVSVVSADLAVLRARIHSDVFQILTPEQRDEARAMRQRFEEFASERWSQRGWSNGPRGLQSQGD